MDNDRGFNLGMTPVKGADGNEIYAGFAVVLSKLSQGTFIALPCDIIERDGGLIRYKRRGLDWQSKFYKVQQTKFPAQFIMKEEITS